MGARYASAGTDALRVLVWGVVPAALIQAYYARSRAVHRLWEAIATATVSGTVTVVAVAAAGAEWGLTAMASGWVVSQSVAAVWAVWRLRAMGGGRATKQVPPGARRRCRAAGAGVRPQVSTPVEDGR